MLSKVRKALVYDPDHPPPQLEDTEHIVREGTGARIRGFGGARKGALVLTNKRLMWFETTWQPWPLKPITGRVMLEDVADVDNGNLLSFLFGGMRIRMRLRSGKVESIYECDGRLDEWISAIRSAVVSARNSARGTAP